MMKMRANVFRSACLALLFASSAAQAAAQTKNCLSRNEFEGLMTFALPVVIEKLRDQCMATLPATAPLVQAGPLISARYQVDADAAWPLAKQAFDKMSGVRLAGIIGQNGTRGLIESAISDGVSKDIEPEDCPLVDRMVDILQPLPTRNMAMLVATLFEIGDRKKAKSGPFSLCQTPKAQ